MEAGIETLWADGDCYFFGKIRGKSNGKIEKINHRQ